MLLPPKHQPSGALVRQLFLSVGEIIPNTAVDHAFLQALVVLLKPVAAVIHQILVHRGRQQIGPAPGP